MTMNTNKIREALETALNARERDTAHDVLLREAIAELDKAPKVLTDEEIERIAYNRYLKRYYNGDREWQQRLADAMSDGLRYASDNGYLAPAAGLTVEEVMRVVAKWDIEASDEAGVEPATPYGLGDLRSRLAAAMEAKTRKP